ncbi:type VI secretion system protein ImpH [Modicisalibacter ilicicola DSM 19980]|uniref:Type VI secretion system protein ImpH n=1 Tax=Modicisalibacter ilicicola DSM 19980 TaxID=1121942 RepID=A0A1M5B2P0_9GAMM|nr:type VI secretion system baseplate subunit TssG [Halomonas ilicicola]SHF36821.1 type VI secretion system protein ImpH [Halomonas ilicicola DSM 19980]
MDLSAGPTAPDIALAPLIKGARRYDFFQLVDLIHRHHDDDIERGDVALDRRIRFRASASLGFPGSDVTALKAVRSGAYEMEVSFLGLQGAQSPLPGYYLETLAHEAAHGEGNGGDFLDFFNHRLLNLLYRSWRKYRHYIRHQDGARDGFSASVFALVGLGDADLRGETAIDWSKMLAYAGLLAGRSRSPQIVAGIIGHCFDLSEVTIEEWVKRWVAIPQDQRSSTGLSNMMLGSNVVAGEHVADIGGKFALCLGGLTLTRFRDFLPDGCEHAPLRTLVDFVLREPLAYDLELELLPSEMRPLRLGDADSCQLGWTTFVAPGDTPRRQRVRIQMTR